MKISERDIKIWSSIGTRATFGIAALELAKEHKDLKHEYYHQIAESLGEIIDPDDLPHEYKTEVQKYIRASLPEYNCLT